MRAATFKTTALVLSLAIGAGCASGRTVSKRRGPQPTYTWKQAVYFDFDKSEVRGDAHAVLDDVAGRMKGDEKAVAILEGHADPIGESYYNEALAEDRARSVRVYLRDQGADAHRITMTSKGERDPVVQGYGRKDLEPNRRVDVILTLTGSEEESKKEEGK
ncbi:MAG TPA: OmpA family protein [bacterium]|nr:OmpA family protein [bacterium]